MSSHTYITELALSKFPSSAAANRWLNSPLPYFKHKTPLELSESNEGLKTLKNILASVGLSSRE